MFKASAIDRLIAASLILLTGLVALKEWGAGVPALLPEAVTLLLLGLLSLRVRWTRRAFVLTGIALSVWLAVAGLEWVAISRNGLDKAAFIAAFFAALSTLRNAAGTSPSLGRAGRFLAAQPPGRRYAALTFGGHVFALLLNYGAISLLGSLSTQAARSEPDAVIRQHRTRRMLLAIQRGFVASLPWSPLAFAMAVTTAVIPGASWAGAALPGLGSAAIISAAGWAMDSFFKPRLGRLPPRKPAEGSWALMMPLLGLLVLLAAVLSVLHAWTGIRVVGIVMLVVPALSIAWAVAQGMGAPQAVSLRRRARAYVDRELPGYKGELVLLMMAGYIGTVGAPLLLPIVESSGLSLGMMPGWAVLTLLVWIVPVLGQLGMNPILAVTLIAPLVPGADVIGVTPDAVVAAIVAGWALSGLTSPFTATTLLIGSFGNVSALHVGLRWNGGFFGVAASCLTLWVLAFAFLLAGP